MACADAVDAVDGVQVGGGHKYIAILVRQNRGHAPSFISDDLDGRPPAQWGDQPFCLRPVHCSNVWRDEPGRRRRGEVWSQRQKERLRRGRA